MIDIKSMVVFLSRYEHVPKINGEIPSADEATSDHERSKKSMTWTRSFMVW
ncbi:hypothetical protein ACS0TY_030683 [Phlomoides rotata]